jgi:hypothetical protein
LLKEVNKMRRGFGLVIGLVLTIILLMVVGAVAYNVGWSAAANMHAASGAAAPGPYYYGYHPFFAGFGILWFLLILFGIFWLLRFAFFGRMWGGGWGYRRGGYGPGPGGMPHGIEARMEEWHRRAHGEQPPPGTATPPPPPPPSDTRSV